MGRIGGDEFILLLSRISLKTAVGKLQTLERKIHQLGGELSISTTVSVSLGVCHTRDADGSFEDTFQKADRALYLAKEEGKNRIGVYRQEPDAGRAVSLSRNATACAVLEEVT